MQHKAFKTKLLKNKWGRKSGGQTDYTLYHPGCARCDAGWRHM